MPGAVQVLGPFQRGGHEEQEGPVHAVNGGQVTPAARIEPCFGLGVRERIGLGETYTHTLRWMSRGWAGEERAHARARAHARVHTHAQSHCWAQGWAREAGLTVNFHVECVIFAVTGTVGTEAKTLYSLCGSGKREASVRGRLLPPGGGGRK